MKLKNLLLMLPLAACTAYIDPCLRPCNQTLKECTCVEMDHSDRDPAAAVGGSVYPDVGGNGGARSADNNRDVSSDDSNGDNSNT